MNNDTNLSFNLDKLERHLPKWNRFESPIEEILSECLTKYAAENATLSNQVEVNTSRGNFRLDFMIQIGSHKIAMEANGKDYHNAYFDCFRAGAILEETNIESIYYIKGKDLYYHPEKALYVISAFESRIFSKRALNNFSSKCEMLEFEIKEKYSSLTGFFQREDRYLKLDPSEYTEDRHRVKVQFLTKNIQIWKILMSFMNKHPKARIDELVNLNKEKMPIVILQTGKS